MKNYVILFFGLLFLSSCTLTYDTTIPNPYYYNGYYWRYHYPYYHPNYGNPYYGYPRYYHYHYKSTPSPRPSTPPRHYGPRK